MQILTDTVSSEINRSGKDKYCVSPLGVSRAAKLIETERRMRVLVTRSWGRGEKRIVNGYIVSVWWHARD